MEPTDAAEPRAFLSGGGDMGALMRSLDWSATPLGPAEAWPSSLRTSVSICLNSRFPLLIWWGPELVMLYNDPYRPILGNKHPTAMGQRGRECWPEIWDVIGPMLAGVLDRGEATWSEDQMLLIERAGFPEECYFTFSYSPIRDGSGAVAGVFTAVTETTDRVVGARRLRTLSRLGERAAGQRSPAGVAAAATAALAENPEDVPFSEVRLIEGDEPPPRAREGTVVLPVTRPGDERPAAVLVAGVSPRRPLDDAYRDFFRLVSEQVGSALANAEGFAAERRRAEALAELDRAKTTFFSNVSHEFRTPLTLLLGPLEDALRAPLDGDQRERVEIAHRNATRLLRLVNSLLDFSRLEEGRMTAAFAPVDLPAAVTEIAGIFRSAVERAGLTLRVDCPPLPRTVDADRGMLEKIVLNLLSNAHKYTLEGEIRVAVRDAGDGAEIEVADTGAGIPAAEVPRLFERFHRVEGGPARSHEGTGIGLALVHELVGLHGGSVRVESELGSGSTFVVSLPYTQEDAAAAAPEADPVLRAGYVEEALRWDQTPTTATPPAGDGHVLVVDDNADMRDYLVRLLGARWSVHAVATGAEAVAVARQGGTDLVLTDVMMPGMTGFDLLEELRADPRTRALPVLMLSARAGADSAVEGLDAGADDYVVKPFAAEELIARVGANLELARLRGGVSRRIQALADAVLRISSAASVHDVCVVAAEQATALTGTPVECDLDGSGARLVPARDLDPEARALLAQLEQAAGARIQNAALQERDHRIAETLQRSLLPSALPDVPHVALAGRYVPAHRALDVGGDWYDAVPLGDGRLVLAIGDVAGSGIPAAATMGQARHALRAYALAGLGPAHLLRRLDAVVRGGDEPTMVTCACLLLDPAAGEVRWSSAGHPPPLVRLPDGTTELLAGAVSEPLGVLQGVERAEAARALPPGAALVLYTDGLVERRAEPLDAGIARLRAAIAAPGAEPDALCDAALGQLDGRHEDDVALLVAARVPVPDGPLRLEIPADPGRLADVRRRLRAWLDAGDVPRPVAADVLLATHEAAMNAVEHAYGLEDGMVELTARREGGDLVVSVRDQGTWREPRGAHRGRGQGLMAELVDDVRFDTSDGGSEVVLRRRVDGA